LALCPLETVCPPDALTVKSKPAPESIACTLSVEEEAIRNACSLPSVDGVNVTGIVQLPPLGRIAAQVVVPIEKSPANPPVIEKLRFDSGEAPPLFSVSVNTLLAMPNGCPIKLRLDGLKDSVGGDEPTPDRLTVCVFNTSEIDSIPFCCPIAVGAKITEIAQLDLPVN
jgi:hypothetical protein